MNVRLRRPLDVISGRPEDVRLGRPRDGQIGSLRDVLKTLEGDVLGTSKGPIFADWGNDLINKTVCRYMHFIYITHRSNDSERDKTIISF